MDTGIMLTSAPRKLFKWITVLFLALAGVTPIAQANLISLGALTDFLPGEDPNNPADLAAALNRQYHTGLLTFLAGYARDQSTGRITFNPGAISDTSQLSFTRLDPFSAQLSWNLAGTGFENRFVVGAIRGSDFEGPLLVFRVTPDQFVNSFGSQPPGGAPGPPFTFFGKPISAPESGSTALLLVTALLVLVAARGFPVSATK